jgi:hypothetical protein
MAQRDVQRGAAFGVVDGSPARMRAIQPGKSAACHSACSSNHGLA